MMKISSMLLLLNLLLVNVQKSNTRPYKTGMQAIKQQAKVVSIILLQSAVSVQEKNLKFLGHKSRLVLLSRGSILAVFFKEMIRSESFILLH